jgi:hypothetical protein
VLILGAILNCGLSILIFRKKKSKKICSVLKVKMLKEVNETPNQPIEIKKSQIKVCLVLQK